MEPITFIYNDFKCSKLLLEKKLKKSKITKANKKLKTIVKFGVKYILLICITYIGH